MRVDESKAFADAAAFLSRRRLHRRSSSQPPPRAPPSPPRSSQPRRVRLAAAAHRLRLDSLFRVCRLPYRVGRSDSFRRREPRGSRDGDDDGDDDAAPRPRRLVELPAAYAPVANCSDALSCAVRDEVFPSGDVTSMASLVHAPGAAAVSAAFSGRHTTVSRFDAPGASAKAPHGWT